MPKGLNTEASLLNFPDGYTTEEQNYDLTIRGERRRRLGLALESAGELIDISTTGYIPGDPIKVFDWENVANQNNLNFIVMQVGYTLLIFDDENPTSPTLKAVTLDYRLYSVSEATDAQIAGAPLQAAFGRGHLFLFGQYTNPFYLEYAPEEEVFVINQIDVLERDFEGIDDGYSNSDQPVSPYASHIYNLKNRGWTQAFIDSFSADQAKLPSKAMFPWLGLKRALTPGDTYDDDGARSFSAPKLVSELFQDASAPMGHFIRTPFDGTSSPDDNSSLAITTWTIDGYTPHTLWDFQVTTEIAHGLSVSDEVTISDLRGYYNTSPGLPIIPAFEVNGTYTVTAIVDPMTFVIQVLFPEAWPFVDWRDQFNRLGSLTGAAIPDPTGLVTDFRPKAGAFFAGRVWYGGIDTSRLGGRVYFSQVIESDPQYGKCYQVADPTDERVSDLVASDGGVIVIPEAANVLKLVPYHSSLIVYAANGVWEIGAGDRGYFAADNYSVRKLTDNGAVSEGSIVVMDFIHMYLGLTDIYNISPNPRTGQLEVANVSGAVISTFYNNIPLETRKLSEGVYDDLNRRVIWLYSTDADNIAYSYDAGLVFDERLQAFLPYRFAHSTPTYLAGIFILREAGAISKVKYLGISTGGLSIGEASNYTTYTDFGIAEPECYMITAYDSVRDPGSFKVAPVVWVFSRKTETGYDESHNAIRPSSTLMQARWEWADNANASRWGTEQEVYRHQRTYVPVNDADTYDDGIPCVTTKNKLRGRGRVLQLKFTAGEGKDSFIMGWKTNFIRIPK